MCCGKHATQKKRLRFTSHPLWVYILLPMGWLPYAIVAALLTERVRCYTHFCDRHRRYWLRRTLISWACFAGLVVFSLGSLVLTVLLREHISEATQRLIAGWLCPVTIALGLLWLMSIPIMQVVGIHPADVTEDSLTLKGISQDFAEAVREYRRERRAEEEAQDQPRRSRRRPPDASQEYYDPDRGPPER